MSAKTIENNKIKKIRETFDLEFERVLKPPKMEHLILVQFLKSIKNSFERMDKIVFIQKLIGFCEQYSFYIQEEFQLFDFFLLIEELCDGETEADQVKDHQKVKTLLTKIIN